MQHGIPAVMFITWPDMWYHSSEDTPDKQDSTQDKRAAAVGLGSLASLATGSDEMAARILQENLGRGLARMGESHTKGLGYLADVTDPAKLNGAWREAEVAVRHQVSDPEAGDRVGERPLHRRREGQGPHRHVRPADRQPAQRVARRDPSRVRAAGRAARRHGAGRDNRNRQAGIVENDVSQKA